MDGTSFVQLGILSAEALERLVRAREGHNENRKGARLRLVKGEPGRSAAPMEQNAADLAAARTEPPAADWLRAALMPPSRVHVHARGLPRRVRGSRLAPDGPKAPCGGGR
jgi:hypothetical protein